MGCISGNDKTITELIFEADQLVASIYNHSGKIYNRIISDKIENDILLYILKQNIFEITPLADTKNRIRISLYAKHNKQSAYWLNERIYDVQLYSQSKRPFYEIVDDVKEVSNHLYSFYESNYDDYEWVLSSDMSASQHKENKNIGVCFSIHNYCKLTHFAK